jgi:hypothetical protein
MTGPPSCRSCRADATTSRSEHGSGGPLLHGIRGPVQFERRLSSPVRPAFVAADRDTSPANLRGGVPVAWVGRLKSRRRICPKVRDRDEQRSSQDPVEGKGPRADRHSRPSAHEGPTTARRGAFVSRQHPALGEDNRRSISSGSATWARLGAAFGQVLEAIRVNQSLPEGVSSPSEAIHAASAHMHVKYPAGLGPARVGTALTIC